MPSFQEQVFFGQIPRVSSCLLWPLTMQNKCALISDNDWEKLGKLRGSKCFTTLYYMKIHVYLLKGLYLHWRLFILIFTTVLIITTIVIFTEFFLGIHLSLSNKTNKHNSQYVILKPNMQSLQQNI